MLAEWSTTRRMSPVESERRKGRMRLAAASRIAINSGFGLVAVCPVGTRNRCAMGLWSDLHHGLCGQVVWWAMAAIELHHLDVVPGFSEHGRERG